MDLDEGCYSVLIFFFHFNSMSISRASMSRVQHSVWGNSSGLSLKGLHSFWKNKYFRHQRGIMQAGGLKYEVDIYIRVEIKERILWAKFGGSAI